MTPRRSLALACALALLHSGFFVWYQQPDWRTQWTDQEGYVRLGTALAETGRFTSYPDSARFIPEVIRTPAYPMFLAALYKTLGTSQIGVAAAQAMLFALICLMVYGITRRVASGEVAVAAAFVTALFPPIPYFGALVMTEVWTTFLFTAVIWVAVRALDTRSAGTFVAVGVLCALTALSRPAFLLFPLMLAALGIALFPLLGIRSAMTPKRVALLLAAAVVVLLPWFTYNFVNLGRFTLSPAGGLGRGTWEGSWQAVWPGRLQAELTHLAETVNDRTDLDRTVTGVASRERLDAGPMLDYVHQWQELHAIWANPTDPYERTMARAAADREYLRVGLSNIERDRRAHQIQRMARGAFILWAGEIPFRYSDINTLPVFVVRLCWLIQALIFAAAVAGVLALGRERPAAAWLLAAPIVYVTAVHVPLLTEARQSLPAQPVLLILATLGVAHLFTRRSHPGTHARSLAVEPQAHKGEHL